MSRNKKLTLRKRPSFISSTFHLNRDNDLHPHSLTPDMPWENDQSYYNYIAGVNDYLDNADKMRRISLQNSQFFSDSDAKKNSISGFRVKKCYSSEGSALLDFEESLEEDESEEFSYLLRLFFFLRRKAHLSKPFFFQFYF